MKQISLIILLLLGVTIHSFASEDPTEKEREEAFVPIQDYICDLYNDVNDGTLNATAFELAIKGYSELYLQNKIRNERYLTVVDMTLSSNTERMYIIDLQERRLIKKTLVAHGMKTGDEYAEDFSNEESSHKSSLGFFLTGELYDGRHDLSMKLDGLEYSNDNARKRGVVVHSADYVSSDFIEGNGRLGRSYGCPAIPNEDYENTVEKLQGGSCFFIYYPDKHYLSRSKIINRDSNIVITSSGKVSVG